MKTTIKFFVYTLLCIACGAFCACSHDDSPFEEPSQPNNPGGSGSDDEQPTDPMKELAGEWNFATTDFGIQSGVASTGVMEISTNGTIKMQWAEKDAEEPYSVLNGKCSVDEETLKIEWTTATTTGITNAAFTTFYLEGNYTVNNNKVNYSYEVYNDEGTKLSGPHNISWNKE